MRTELPGIAGSKEYETEYRALRLPTRAARSGPFGESPQAVIPVPRRSQLRHPDKTDVRPRSITTWSRTCSSTSAPLPTSGRPSARQQTPACARRRTRGRLDTAKSVSAVTVWRLPGAAGPPAGRATTAPPAGRSAHRPGCRTPGRSGASIASGSPPSAPPGCSRATCRAPYGRRNACGFRTGPRMSRRPSGSGLGGGDLDAESDQDETCDGVQGASHGRLLEEHTGLGQHQHVAAEPGESEGRVDEDLMSTPAVMPPTVRRPSCQPDAMARSVTTAMSGPGTTVRTASTPVAARS